MSESPHWSENPLLHTLLPSLVSSLQCLNSLSHQCSFASFSSGKLMMQSDLNMASFFLSLSTHISYLTLFSDLPFSIKMPLLYPSLILPQTKMTLLSSSAISSLTPNWWCLFQEEIARASTSAPR
ncbi:hypothetical protein N665_0218s0075 [Sinapis alba]|nr:hypothetical protein N665_0218s0075 [Sinapis alba]